MRIGITGWRGFIGNALREKVKNPVLFQGDMTNYDAAKEFTQQCDRIYHIAGKNREVEGKVLANNLVATGNLFLACKLQDIHPEIVFVSSKQVETNQQSEYGATKMLEEHIVMLMRNWCIYRIPNVYGSGGRPFYNSVVATFAYQIAYGDAVTINDPADTREFLYIDDLLDELLNPKFSQYILPQGEKMSIGQIYEYMTTGLGEHDKLKKCIDYYTGGLK